MKKLLSFLLLLAVVSCTNTKDGVFYEKVVPLEKHNWQRFDKISFEVPVKKNDRLDFYFEFQYNDDFKDIYLPINITFYTPGGEMRSRNYKYKLADRNSKKRFGTKENNHISIVLPIRKEMPFIKDGICKVIIEKKISRVDTYGIIAVGLKAEKSQPVKK